MRTVSALALLSVAVSFCAAAQEDSGKLILAGTVVNSITGAPLRNVRVMRAPGGEDTETITDASGAFKFTGLEPTTYVLMANRDGFEAHEGEPVEVARSVENFVLRLTPLGSIRGRVTDDEGEPAEGVVVLLLRMEIADGRRRYTLAGSARTDDRGEYRSSQLRAATYVVKAAGHFSIHPYFGEDAPTPKTRETFAPVYYGGARTAQSAIPVTLAAGAEGRADISLTMEAGRRIRGRITNLPPDSGAILELLKGDEDLGLNRSSVNLGTGQFEVHDVLDGAYRLRATAVGTQRETVFAEQDVIVAGRDIDGLSLTLVPALAAEAKVRIEGPPHEGAEDHGFGFWLDALEGIRGLSAKPGSLSSRRREDGDFEIHSVIPGRYRAGFQVGGPLYVSSARAGNLDLLAAPEFVVGPGTPAIEVVLRTDGGSLEGSIPPELLGSDDAEIVLLPESPGRPAESTVSDSDGTFEFEGIAPGMYRLHAWKASVDVEYASPPVRAALAGGGTQVEIKPSAQTKVRIDRLSEPQR